MDKLLEQAKALGLEVKDGATEDEVKTLITDKEAANAELEKKKDKEADPEYLKSELKKVIDQRDTAKKDRRSLQTKIDVLEKAIEDAPNSGEFKELKDSLTELKEYKETIETEKEEKELAQKTELERTQITFQKELDKLRTDFESEKVGFQKLTDDEKAKGTEKDKEIEVLRKVSLENEILGYASEGKAIRPRQIVGLLKDQFEFVPTLGKFIHSIYDSKGKLTDTMEVAEMVESFLKDPNNDNLVESSANTQGMDTKKTTDTKHIDLKDLKGYNPKDPKLIKEAGEKGLTVEELIVLKQKRDEKLAKVQESKNK